ncbi:conjugal transfer protein TraI [Pedobacter nutrimenti]|uniref:conjugal transfer protein TraI n=1 Tax=Pedobacter nutrimenti TaxID=1241337 RepID=UPI00292E51A8|nr:conjugal transfer protein TraI [Pedobacter nutrimenti]
MKKILTMILLVLTVTLVPVKQSHAQIPIIDIIKAAVKKVIRAVDLQIQRQQNKIIWLQNAQKVLENAMSKLKLREISEWTEKQKELYKVYFDELKKVRTIITYYQRIREVIQKQESIITEYRRAWSLVRSDKHFTPQEIEYMGKVYSGILDQSVSNMEQLYLVINSFRTQMTDAKRIEMINTAAEKVNENYIDLRDFNSDNGMLSLQRAKSEQEVDLVRKLYGLK